MCGVVGYVPSDDPNPLNQTRFRNLMKQSQIRGMHAWGYCQHQGDLFINRHKATRVDSLFPLLDEIPFFPEFPGIGHTRYSTSGDWHDDMNNQPLYLEYIVFAFNGVVDMGTKAEMERKWGMLLDSGNDGELAVKLAEWDRLELKPGYNRIPAIPGTFAGVWLTREGNMYVARNEYRPLWNLGTEDGSHWIASTADIFARAGFNQTPEPIEPDIVHPVYSANPVIPRELWPSV